MLKKIALCASVLTLSALGGAAGALAYEAPADSFYPAAGWDLSTMPAQTGTGQHCLLVSEYNNGFFVQFQGKDGALEVIGIDLRQAVFQEGQSVPVTITVPGRTSIQINGTAFSKEVVTLDMSGQDGLLDMLRSASAMDIDIAGSAFRFFLTGFTNALQGFDRCNHAVPQEAFAAETVDAPAVEEIAIVEEESAVVEEVAGAVVPEEPAAKIATGEPVRTAPSENMKRRQEREKEKFDAEIARIMPREDSVTADLQRQMEESGQTLADIEDMSAPPQKSASRFTEQLAQEMGTAVETRAAAEPVRSISAERMARAEVEMPVENVPVSVPENELPPEEVIDFTATSESNAEPEIIETAAIVEETEAIEEVETVVEVEQKKSLMEELKAFVGRTPKGIPPAETKTPPPSVTADLVQNEVEAAREEEIVFSAPEETELTPALAPPVTETIASTPEMQVTRTVSSAQADFTDIPVDAVPAVPPAMMDRRVSELEAKLTMLERENEALNAELELSLRSSEQERLEISSDNWNLEQATMRFNEAERQIAQLGQQVQKERAQCAVEKKELEMMLFDPQMTEQAQLGHLAKLESELDAARAEIRTLRAQLGN